MECQMPRFFFHIAGAEERIPDDAGVDLPDPIAAHERALTLISQVMKHFDVENGMTPEEWSGWIVHVADTNGRKFLSVPFLSNQPAEVRSGAQHRVLTRIMHHAARFCMSDEPARVTVPSGGIGARQLVMQRVWGLSAMSAARRGARPRGLWA